MTRVYLTDCSVLQNEEIYNKYYSALPLERKEKADKLLHKSDKCLSVGAWSLLGAALGEKSRGEILFEKNGKPYIKNCPLKFNISHSGTLAFCAVSEGDIGCDIEMHKDANMKVARRFFFRDEIDLLENQKTEEDQKEMFFRLWTLKESFMKATGLGFRLALSDFCMYFENGIPLVKQNVDGREYRFKEYNISSINKKYAAAVCSAAQDAFFNDINYITL